MENKRLTLSSSGRRQFFGETGDAQLTIAVSSVDLRDSTLDMAQQQRQYLHKAFRFYELVSTNHQGLQDNLRDHLKQELHTAITKVGVTAEGLAVTVSYPVEKVVALQCHQSSGRLLAEIQQHLVTHKTLRELDVTDLTLMVQLHRI